MHPLAKSTDVTVSYKNLNLSSSKQIKITQGPGNNEMGEWWRDIPELQEYSWLYTDQNRKLGRNHQEKGKKKQSPDKTASMIASLEKIKDMVKQIMQGRRKGFKN